MSKNGVIFSRVVKKPIGFWDLSEEITQFPDFSEAHRAALVGWNDKGSIDALAIDETIDRVLNVLVAEFSVIDYDNIRRMCDDITPEDLLDDSKYGMSIPEGTDIVRAQDMSPDQQYQVIARTMTLTDVYKAYHDARKYGSSHGIGLIELQNAMQALQDEHLLLLAGQKRFNEYEDPATMVLNGHAIIQSTRENREDIALNVIFASTPAAKGRLAEFYRNHKPNP